MQKKSRIVVKVGTSTLTHENGSGKLRAFEDLAFALSDIQNSGVLFFHYRPKDPTEDLFIPGKRIAVLPVGNADAHVISVCPQIKTFPVQHILAPDT